MPLVAAVGQAGHGRVDTRDGDEERILDSRRRKLLPRSGRLLLLQLLAAACSSAKESCVEQFPTRGSVRASKVVDGKAGVGPRKVRPQSGGVPLQLAGWHQLLNPSQAGREVGARGYIRSLLAFCRRHVRFRNGGGPELKQRKY